MQVGRVGLGIDGRCEGTKRLANRLDWQRKRKAEELVEDIREGPSNRGGSGVRETFDSSAIIVVTS